MSVFGTALRRASSVFFSDENGAITVESVLWLPIWLGFFSFIADVSLILHNQANAMRIVQDTHRAQSLGYYDDLSDVEAVIEYRLKRMGGTSAEATSEVTDGVLRTVVSLKASDFVAVGLITKITDVDLSFASYHLAAEV